MWIRRGEWNGAHILEEQLVEGITPYLTRLGAVQGDPYRLVANASKAFTGVKVYGQGFLLEPNESHNRGRAGEPQPDLALVTDVPAGRLPGPEEVVLVVEVSDTTLPYDKNIKLPLYARTGIPETWIVDLHGEVVEVHAEPRPNGYDITRRYDREGDQLRSETLQDLTLPVADILG